LGFFDKNEGVFCYNVVLTIYLFFKEKEMKRYGLILVLCMFLSAFGLTHAQNLLVNGDFETPDLTGVTPPVATLTAGGWTEFGTVGIPTQEIRAATYAAEAPSAQGVWLKGWRDNEDAGFYQDVADIAPGDTYVLDGGFKVQANFTQSGNVDMELIWLDAVDEEIGRETLDVDSIVPNDNTWGPHLSITSTAPAGTAKARCQIHWTTGDQILTGQASTFVDNMSLEMLVMAKDPWPGHLSSQIPDTVNNAGNLEFSLPDIPSIINYNVYWQVDDVNDAAWSNPATGSGSANDRISVAVPETIIAGHTYYWKVDLDADTGPSEPNLIEGALWWFKTASEPPVVDAGGPVFQNVWMSGGEAIITLNGFAFDDGLPNPPGELTILWTSDIEGADFLDASDPQTDVTFTAAGNYTLTVSADDGDVAVTDSISVRVLAEGYDGLVALYEFDSAAEGVTADSAGEHDGTLAGNAVIDSTDVKVGSGCLLLAGTDDSVQVLDSGVAEPNWPDVDVTWADMQDTNQMTVSTWIKVEPGQFNQNWQPIISKGDAYAVLRNGPDSSNAMFRIGAGSTTNPGPEVAARDNDAVNIVLDDGQWHQIAGTFDGLAVRIYVDGILERQTDNPAYLNAMPLGGAYLQIGNGLNGRIDRVRVHDVALTGEMIMAQFIADGGSNSCRQQYSITDMDQDCYTGLGDLAVLASEWLACIDVTNPLCN
jgi:hypothetical protein